MAGCKFSYDAENDDLFIYTGEKSKGSVEFGNFVLDMNGRGKLVALQVLDASETFAAMVKGKIKDFRSLKNCRIDVVNLRNAMMIRISLCYADGEITPTLYAPRITETSPAIGKKRAA